MQPPSKQSLSAWTVVLVLAIAVIGLGLLAGHLEGPSDIISPTCTNSAYARGIC